MTIIAFARDNAGMTAEVTTIVLAIVIGFFTVVGGVGGSIYVAYFSCALILSIVLVYFVDIFYNPLDRANNDFGSAAVVYNLVKCANAPAASDNEDFSLMTFLSRGGLIEGVLIVLSTCGGLVERTGGEGWGGRERE